MEIEFYKYQGTGNDFVIIDNRQGLFDKNNTKLVKYLCDRRFGIGGDGLILLENHDSVDFKMVYYNSDGNESSMCGNGGRCISAFAKHLGIINDKAVFEAIDGMHDVEINDNLVKLKMQDVNSISNERDYSFLDTGSPHYVTLCSGLQDLNVKEKGAEIRYNDTFKAEGTNVNFVEPQDNSVFRVRTYERGVEDETLSCGTGVTAVALAMNYIGETEKNLVTINTEGGQLQVSFDREGEDFTNIWLIGPAEFVFKGNVQW